MNQQDCEAGQACFFSGLDARTHADLEKNLIKNKYQKGQIIVHEGTTPHGVFVVFQGKTKSYKADETGRQLILRFGGPGDVGGYRSVLLGLPFEETMETIEDSVIGFLEKDTFLELIGRNPILNRNLVRLLARELGRTEDRALQMAYHSAHRRLATILSEMKPVRNGSGKGYILPAMLRQELAEMAGLAVETTIRTLKDMEASRIIHLKGRQIAVLDAQKLADLCSEAA